jgi:hypothetical protein
MLVELMANVTTNGEKSRPEYHRIAKEDKGRGVKKVPKLAALL